MPGLVPPKFFRFSVLGYKTAARTPNIALSHTDKSTKEWRSWCSSLFIMEENLCRKSSWNFPLGLIGQPWVTWPLPCCRWVWDSECLGSPTSTMGDGPCPQTGRRLGNCSKEWLLVGDHAYLPQLPPPFFLLTWLSPNFLSRYVSNSFMLQETHSTFQCDQHLLKRYIGK